MAECLANIARLAPDAREACCALAAHLRERHTGFYQRTADETETLLGDEEEIARAEDLGRIDTFRFEEKKVLEAAMEALGARDWDTSSEYAAARTGGASLWIRLDLARQSAWQLVTAAAALGQAVARAGEDLGPDDHASALARYREVGAGVDRALLELEQARVKLLSPQLPGFEILRARLDDMREVWRAWTDASDCTRGKGKTPEATVKAEETQSSQNVGDGSGGFTGPHPGRWAVCRCPAHPIERQRNYDRHRPGAMHTNFR